MSDLTTNDVRVIRHLTTHGQHTSSELAAALRYGPGSRPALLRIPKLLDRGLITDARTTRGHAPLFDVTGEGVRALRACDRGAYGNRVGGTDNTGFSNGVI